MSALTLTLVRRARVADLVGVDERCEASGQLVRDGLLLVVCDNAGMVFIPDPAWRSLAPPGDPTTRGRGRGYEGIAADPATWRLFVLVEALPSHCRGRAEALAPPIGANDQLEPQGRQHQLADFGRRTSSGLGITLKVASGGLATSSGGRDVARAQHVRRCACLGDIPRRQR